MTDDTAYDYNAAIIRWVDGDTVWLTAWKEEELDFGFRARLKLRFEHDLECRLYGIDTPERGHLNYKEASAFARELAPTGTSVDLSTFKDPEKYGRWLATVRVPGHEQSINVELVNAGLAKPYFGGTKDAS
jgi:micrococcal nuclease